MGAARHRRLVPPVAAESVYRDRRDPGLPQSYIARVAGPFAHDAYVVKQLIRPLVNVYEVRAAVPGSDAPGELVAFVRQKRAAIKEDIRAFADDSENHEVFRIRARSVFDVAGRYDVTAADGAALGTLEKLFGRSLLRSSWRVLAPDGAELMSATEKSTAVAIGRRVKDLLPFGELLPLPYHFTFLREDRPVGELRRIYGLRDQYALELGGDPDGTIDRRLAIALAVALDALQAR